MTVEFKPAKLAAIFFCVWLATAIGGGIAKYANEVMYIIHQDLERACKK
jgi:hypothetical protein